MTVIGKPLVKLTTDESIDTADADGRSIPLIKTIPEDVVQRTYGDLIDYMVSPEADELNPEYNDKQKELARRIEYWIGGIRNGTQRATFNLFRSGPNGQRLNPPIDFAQHVADTLPGMTHVETVVGPNGPIEYNQADLELVYHQVGGLESVI